MLAWLSQDSIPERKVLAISLPDSEAWLSQFRGAFLELSKAENWEEFGLLSPEEMADEWRAIFFDFVAGGASMIPVGTIMPYAGDTAPSGFFLCDFSEFDRDDFAELFTIIGTRYGSGNGTTTANLPDLRGRVIVGFDVTDSDFNSLSDFGGQKSVTLELDEIPSHNHTQNSHSHVQDSHNHTQNSHLHTGNAHNHTQAAHGHTVQPHKHDATFQAIAASGSARSIITSFVAAQQAVAETTAITDNVTPGINNTTPTINAQTATNQVATATNQAATAVNQASGGGIGHNNLQPYWVMNYIIKY